MNNIMYLHMKTISKSGLVFLAILTVALIGGGVMFFGGSKEGKNTEPLSNANSIIIVSPAGGETYAVGDVIPLRWQVNGKVNPFYMELVDASGKTVSNDIVGLGIGGPILNDWKGSYALDTKGFPLGAYKMHMTTFGKELVPTEAYSGLFTMISPKPVISIGSIELFSDSDGSYAVIKGNGLVAQSKVHLVDSKGVETDILPSFHQSDDKRIDFRLPKNPSYGKYTVKVEARGSVSLPVPFNFSNFTG